MVPTIDYATAADATALEALFRAVVAPLELYNRAARAEQLALSPRSLGRFGAFPELALNENLHVHQQETCANICALGLAGLPLLAAQQTRRLTLRSHRRGPSEWLNGLSRTRRRTRVLIAEACAHF